MTLQSASLGPPLPPEKQKVLPVEVGRAPSQLPQLVNLNGAE